MLRLSDTARGQIAELETRERPQDEARHGEARTHGLDRGPGCRRVRPAEIHEGPAHNQGHQNVWRDPGFQSEVLSQANERLRNDNYGSCSRSLSTVHE